MPKRKRASSESCCSSLPLTVANLERLQAALSPTAAMSTVPRSPSPKRNTSNLDQREKLSQYRIHVDTDRKLPASLQQHVEALRKPPNVATSPNAKKIVQRRRMAARQNEPTGSPQIVPYMLFAGEADMDERVEAVPNVTRKAELLFNRFFLPPAPSAQVKETWKELSQPKPDTCIGYVSRSDAAAADCDAPFTPEQEAILDNYVLTKALYMPFLTAQWKTPARGTLYEAVSQAARDGAVIVNHLYDFYSVAHNTAPSPVDMCHFSFVSDLEYGQIWIHWREGMDHYMEHVHDFSLRREEDIQKARGILHNIKNYANAERLETIRHALPAFSEARKQPGRYPSVPASEASASASGLSQYSASVNFPRTPLSVVSEPTKGASARKRQRVESNEALT